MPKRLIFREGEELPIKPKMNPRRAQGTADSSQKSWAESHRFTFTLTEETDWMYNALCAFAKDNDLSLSEAIKYLVVEELKKHNLG